MLDLISEKIFDSLIVARKETSVINKIDTTFFVWFLELVWLI